MKNPADNNLFGGLRVQFKIWTNFNISIPDSKSFRSTTAGLFAKVTEEQNYISLWCQTSNTDTWNSEDHWSDTIRNKVVDFGCHCNNHVALVRSIQRESLFIFIFKICWIHDLKFHCQHKGLNEDHASNITWESCLRGLYPLKSSNKGTYRLYSPIIVLAF